MSLWYMAHLTTYLDLKSLSRFKDPGWYKSNLTSAISNFSELQHLASYITPHNAMA
jgi:hypothetical protein